MIRSGGHRVVAIGGGTGLAVLLRGLRPEVAAGRLSSLTGIVTVADDGGSSGRLRRELGVLPPGDIRNCLVALADEEDLLARLFQYRFPAGEGLSGHSFGNLFLTALAGITGDFYQAILTAETILSVRGKILPATLADVRLIARGVSGRRYDGESAIGRAGEPLRELTLEPGAPAAFPAAVEALSTADLIVLGPGSLFTSTLPNLLIPGIRNALVKRRGRCVLLLNLMTQPGETDGMDGPAHLAAIERSCPGAIDAVLAHDGDLPEELLGAYRDTGASPVAIRPSQLERQGVEVVAADLLAAGSLIRHDPEKLARALRSVVVGTEGACRA